MVQTYGSVMIITHTVKSLEHIDHKRVYAAGNRFH